MRITKIAAIAAIALGTAAPMAMAGTYSRGVITSIDPAAGTVSIDGADYLLSSGAAQGAFAVGDHVLVKTNSHGSWPSINRMIPQD